jgi:hypothetical protein
MMESMFCVVDHFPYAGNTGQIPWTEITASLDGIGPVLVIQRRAPYGGRSPMIVIDLLCKSAIVIRIGSTVDVGCHAAVGMKGLVRRSVMGMVQEVLLVMDVMMVLVT